MKISDNFVTLVPAYGRDYKNRREVEQAFKEGKDFVIQHYNLPSTLCSVRDFEKGLKVQLRYKNKTAVTIVTIN